jgi:hypothetical protein
LLFVRLESIIPITDKERKMKLTKYDRDAFISSVMHDTPSVDYAEQARALVHKEAVAKAPQKIKSIYSDNSLRGFLKFDKYYNMPHPLGSVRTLDTEFKNDELNEKLNELAKKHKEQSGLRNDLSNKVKAVIYACSTLKQATERLPEFIKYLPKNRDEITSGVPSVVGLVEDLTKAGWPKK